MNFVKIGSSYLNLDRATEIRDTGVDIEVFYGPKDVVTLRGADAEKLRKWLNNRRQGPELS